MNRIKSRSLFIFDGLYKMMI